MAGEARSDLSQISNAKRRQGSLETPCSRNVPVLIYATVIAILGTFAIGILLNLGLTHERYL